MIDDDVRSPLTEPVRSARHRVDGDGWTGIVLVAALVAMALVAGLNYTFAVAVMPNLAGADDRTFVATVQRFNENPVFPLSFAAALVLTALAALLQRRHRPGVAVRWTVAAFVLYAIVLAVTGGIHIPLNDEITRAGDPDRIADLAHVRDQFEAQWVAWNVVRTVFCTAAVAALAWALVLHGRSTAGRTAGRAAGASWAPPASSGRVASSHPPTRPATEEHPTSEDPITIDPPGTSRLTQGAGFLSPQR